MMQEKKDEILLEVQHLKVHYPVGKKGKKQVLKAVDGISFSVKTGEAFGIVGESGCGKSTTGKAVVRLLAPTEGRILFRGEDISRIKKGEGKALARKIQMIFQDPYSSLDPRFQVGKCIEEPMRVQGDMSGEECRKEALRLMQEVGLREEQYTRYPHEFSGGQRQRIGVARAIALHPELVICDEPVSALDVSIQAQILNLMKKLQEKYNLTYIFISHNLSVVRHFCDRIAVMYLGNIVELADKKELFSNPRHPYTRALLEAIPVADPDVDSMNGVLQGDVPSPVDPPSGCCFHTRCPMATERCCREKPELRNFGNGHVAACHYAE